MFRLIGLVFVPVFVWGAWGADVDRDGASSSTRSSSSTVAESSALIAEYRKTLAELSAHYSAIRCEGDVHEVIVGPPGLNGPGVSVDRVFHETFAVDSGRTVLSRVQTSDSRYTDIKPIESVWVVEPILGDESINISLHRLDSQRTYSREGINKAKRVNLSYVRSARGFFLAPISVESYLITDLFTSADFSIEKAAIVAVQGERRLHVDFSLKRSPRLMGAKGWFEVDTRRGWSVREYRFQTNDGMRSVHGLVRYVDDGGKIPAPSKVIILGKYKNQSRTERTCRIDCIGSASIPPLKLTMAAFGFGDFTVARDRRLLYTITALIVAAFVSAIILVYREGRFHRFKTRLNIRIRALASASSRFGFGDHRSSATSDLENR